MKRTVLAVLAVAVLICAAPSFGADDRQAANRDATRGPGVTGDPAVSVATAGVAHGVLPANLHVVTGEVLMATPVEFVLRTRSGIRTFEITPQTRMLGGGAEGDVVRVSYVVVPGPASTSAGSSPTTGMASVQPSTNTKATVNEQPGGGASR